MYRSCYLNINFLELSERIQALAAQLLQQFGMLGVALGLIGLIMFRVPSRLYILTIWLATISVVFALFYGTVDSYVYLIPMFISFAIWIGLGITGLINQIPQRFSILGLGLGLLLIGYVTVRSIPQFGFVDASHDGRAESFGIEVLAEAPKGAIIFIKGDQAVFVLWYFHFALHERPDLIVLAEDLLHFDWYQETLQKTYPSLIIPDPFPWPETMARANPLHAVCYVRYFNFTELECSGPLSPP